MSLLPAPLRTALTGALLSSALVVSSCGTSEASGEVSVVPPREAVELIGLREHVVLDLRPRGAYDAAHVADAVSLPAVADDFDERLLGLDPDRKYLLYSRDGEVAKEVAERMVAQGFDDIVDAGAFGLLAIAGAPVE